MPENIEATTLQYIKYVVALKKFTVLQKEAVQGPQYEKCGSLGANRYTTAHRITNRQPCLISRV